METPTTTDIPPHWKLYRLYILVPRESGKVTLKGGDMQVGLSAWEFGRLPAASPMHARTTFWKNCAHEAPALLNASGQPIRKRRMKRASEIEVEEVEETKPAAP